MRSLLTKSIASAFCLATLAGCPAREVAEVDPAQSKEQQKALPSVNNNNVDILFVVDNSGSMTEEQASLSSNFVNFINVLRNIEGGLPDVHIGVVTTNMGGGPGGCEGNGDDGQFQTSSAVSGDFIVDVDDGSETGTRNTNYMGTLETAFSSIAVVGDQGCGFEQPLAAMRRGLERGEQNGFIRENAFLAVIFITDEDDCSSASDQLLFDQSCDEINNCPPGPLHSYRCFEFGVQCEPDNPRQTGVRQTVDCTPRNDSDRVAGVDQFSEFLRNFKGDPSLVITAGIIAPPSDATEVVQIQRTTLGGAALPDALELVPSCSSSAGEGFPGIRLAAFFNAFPSRSTITTICNEDLTDALVQIADLLARLVGSPCLDGDIRTDPIECSVYDVRFAGQDNEEQSAPMPVCDDTNTDPAANNSTNKPCYIIAADAAQCTATDHNLKITIVREAGAEPPIGTETQIRCVAD